MINFQIPNKILKENKKLAQVATCVYYSDHYNLNKVMQWLEYQKRIGVKKVIIYNSQSVLLTRKIYENYNKRFVEIRPYKIHIKQICDSKRYNIYKRFGKFEHQELKDRCKDEFYSNFDNTYVVDVWNYRVATSNDCYISLKFKYEIVTYIDIEEIIYPRYFEIYDFLNSKNNKDCYNICSFKNRKEKNIYDYFTSIINKSKLPKTNVSSIEFKNGIYVELNTNIKNLMENLNEFIRFNKSYFQPKLRLNDENILKLHLKLSPIAEHEFLIDQNDFNYISSLYGSFIRLTNCLEKSNILRGNILDFSFDRFIFFVQEKYLSKFIYFTDNIEAIYSNYNEFKKPGTNVIIADIKDGILSNFKNELFGPKVTNSSIRNLKIDFEYYLNLVTKYEIKC